MSATTSRPPEMAVRAAGRRGAIELRAAGDGGPTLVGHFAVFNVPTEINSLYEGNFIERVAPGAFSETIAHDRATLRVLFQHGTDPQLGDKPLGPIRTLREDSIGPTYEVPLLDTSYTRDLIPGLEAGLYGASFCFRAVAEDWDQAPEPSELNPKGLPERVLREVQIIEFGPVTFPAYPAATAGVRSLSDAVLPAIQRRLHARRELVPARAHQPAAA